MLKADIQKVLVQKNGATFSIMSRTHSPMSRIVMRDEGDVIF